MQAKKQTSEQTKKQSERQTGKQISNQAKINSIHARATLSPSPTHSKKTNNTTHQNKEKEEKKQNLEFLINLFCFY